VIATMTLLSFIPARCWIAPEISTATYRSGGHVAGAHGGAGGAGRGVQLVRKLSRNLKLSPLPIPRPSKATIRAAVFHGDFIEGIHGHLHVRDDDAGTLHRHAR
jgi:hypothetical protein